MGQSMCKPSDPIIFKQDLSLSTLQAWCERDSQTLAHYVTKGDDIQKIDIEFGTLGSTKAKEELCKQISKN